MSSLLSNMLKIASLSALGQAFISSKALISPLKTKKRRRVIIDLERKDLYLYNIFKPNN